MTKVESVRNSEERTLLLDSGGFVTDRRISPQARMSIAELGLRAMDQMGYVSMNLGGIDFSLGTGFLKKVTTDLSFPLITSNLVYRESGLPFGDKYFIADAGDLKVGILGVMPTDAFENMHADPYRDRLEIIHPEKALEALIPELKKKTDILVLLSQCGFDATNLIVDNLDGIDFAIIGGIKEEEIAKIPCGADLEGKEFYSQDRKTLLMQVGRQGESLGLARITVDGEGRIIQRKGEIISVNRSVEPDERIAGITGDDMLVTIRNEREKAKEKREKEVMKEFEKLRRMTPEEYKEYIKRKPVKRAETGDNI